MRRLRTPKVATVTMAFGLVLDGGLAATGTGFFPGPAQRVVSEILRVVGIDVPGADTQVRHRHPAGS
jgi:hypothetical protein